MRATVNPDGTLLQAYDYDPYGNTQQASGSKPTDMRYAGMYLHQPSGLYLTHYRFYDPKTTRWLNRDPIGYAGGLNLYGYVGNNPVNYVDLLGLKKYPANVVGPLMDGDCFSKIPLAPPKVNVYINMALAKEFWSPSTFKNMVKNYGPWDYKRQSLLYEDFGNFNYGATGVSTGLFFDFFLLKMAGYYQKVREPSWGNTGIPFLPFTGMPPFGDDPKDQYWIQQGMDFARNGDTPDCGCQK